VDRDVALRSGSLQDQIRVIRRKLWILNATLDSLHAKIEVAGRKRERLPEGDSPERPRRSIVFSGGVRRVPRIGRKFDRWLRRRSLARLGSDADRAEKRALAAIARASASIGAALEAVRLAAIAREMAEKAHYRPMDPERLS
jgi:hypothetical protein